jgi:hypothetical protein
MRVRHIFLFTACLFPQLLSSKIRILTFQCNQAQFIEYQHLTLKKFLLDDYELIVINDGLSILERNEIDAVCKKYEIKSVFYEQEWHEHDLLNEYIKAATATEHGNDFFCFPKTNGYPDLEKISRNCSIRHCHLIQFALDHYAYNHDDLVVIMDGDVFMIQPTSIRTLLQEVPIVGVDSEFGERHYLWVPFIAFDPKRLPNLKELKFHADLIEGVVCDTGSHSYTYLKNNPGVECQLYPRRNDFDFFPYDSTTFSKLGLTSLDTFRIQWPVEMEFYVDYHFLHFMGGSGTHPHKKFQNLRDIISSVLEQEVALAMPSRSHP